MQVSAKKALQKKGVGQNTEEKIMRNMKLYLFLSVLKIPNYDIFRQKTSMKSRPTRDVLIL